MCMCVCVCLSVCVTIVRTGHILAKIKNVKNELNGVNAKIVLRDADLLFEGTIFKL